jgi:hypothetical protein
MKNINWLNASFCSVLPDNLKANGSCIGVFRFMWLSVGSIVVDIQISTNGVENVTQTQEGIINNLNAKGMSGVRVISINMIYPQLNSPS